MLNYIGRRLLFFITLTIVSYVIFEATLTKAMQFSVLMLVFSLLLDLLEKKKQKISKTY